MAFGKKKIPGLLKNAMEMPCYMNELKYYPTLLRNPSFIMQSVFAFLVPVPPPPALLSFLDRASQIPCWPQFTM